MSDHGEVCPHCDKPVAGWAFSWNDERNDELIRGVCRYCHMPFNVRRIREVRYEVHRPEE